MDLRVDDHLFFTNDLLYTLPSFRKLEDWYKEAFKTGLPEIQKVARMLKRHLENILTYFESYITNAASEGLNSKIQSIKANTRGFRNFENYRISILFFCGRLNLSP